MCHGRFTGLLAPEWGTVAMPADWNSLMGKMDQSYPRFSVLSLWRRYCAGILGLQLFSALSKMVCGSDRAAST
jgi:hypothetical protein